MAQLLLVNPKPRRGKKMARKKIFLGSLILAGLSYHGCNTNEIRARMRSLDQRLDQMQAVVDPNYIPPSIEASKTIYAELPDQVRSDIARLYMQEQLEGAGDSLTDVMEYVGSKVFPTNQYTSSE